MLFYKIHIASNWNHPHWHVHIYHESLSSRSSIVKRNQRNVQRLQAVRPEHCEFGLSVFFFNSIGCYQRRKQISAPLRIANNNLVTIYNIIWTEWSKAYYITSFYLVTFTNEDPAKHIYLWRFLLNQVSTERIFECFWKYT